MPLIAINIILALAAMVCFAIAGLLTKIMFPTSGEGGEK